MLSLPLPLLLLLSLSTSATDPDGAPVRLRDVGAAQELVASAEVVVVGFFKEDGGQGFQEFLSVASRLQTLPFALCSEPEVWQLYNITGDTVSIFRQTDSHQENLQLQERMKIDSDGLTRFIRTNELYYLTEYNDMTAVGLFSSPVRAHLLLLADKRSAGFAQLRELLRALAPQYRGQLLFVLIDGAVSSNRRSLEYFGLKSHDLPAVGLYDTQTDRKWLMQAQEVTTEHVQEFCYSYLRGDLQEQNDPPTSAATHSKSEL
ncbi:endoplasmic reticulum resident protein 27 [Lepisosteus oculatus]